MHKNVSPDRFAPHRVSRIAGASGVAAATAIGCAITATGTATTASMSTTNTHLRSRRNDYLVTTAAATAVAGVRANAAWLWRGNAAGLGGFDFLIEGGPATGVATATSRFFMGLRTSVSAPTDVDPSTQLDCFGIGYDSADANLQLMTNDATGSASKVNTGWARPTADRTAWWRLEGHAEPGGSEIAYTITDVATGAVLSGSIAADLPRTNILLAPIVWSSVGGTSSVVGVAIGDFISTTGDAG